ncbi:unnamed protein product [Medioppia subpectinata]|uniref:Uncharacterized protein n=1 Tax=Medioppia subpectinata TaxID=1979941 RepID=A0A7R9L9K7_9ACAR|nr:unnamed protein product [Medioppia subpectinata]CAG2117096.1 unnamed protein product [Medioppia subpectinata]
MKSIVFLALILAAVVNAIHQNDLADYETVKNSRNFTGKVVLVTGSSSGIGEGIVKLFAYLGAKVVVTGRNVSRIHTVAQEAQQLSPLKLKPLEVSSDLTKAGGVERLISETIKAYGRLDVLVNDAGQYPQSDVHDKNLLDEWDQVFNIDVKAVVHMVHEAVPYLERTNGTVIDISSIGGLHPSVPFLAYSSAKAAVIMMTEVLALELGPKGVRVNAISPGTTNAPKIGLPVQELTAKYAPLRRVGQPLDIAKAAVFLASTDAQYITGHNLVVDGGQGYNIPNTYDGF